MTVQEYSAQAPVSYSREAVAHLIAHFAAVAPKKAERVAENMARQFSAACPANVVPVTAMREARASGRALSEVMAARAQRLNEVAAIIHGLKHAVGEVA